MGSLMGSWFDKIEREEEALFGAFDICCDVDFDLAGETLAEQDIKAQLWQYTVPEDRLVKFVNNTQSEWLHDINAWFRYHIIKENKVLLFKREAPIPITHNVLKALQKLNWHNKIFTCELKDMPVDFQELVAIENMSYQY